MHHRVAPVPVSWHFTVSKAVGTATPPSPTMRLRRLGRKVFFFVWENPKLTWQVLDHAGELLERLFLRRHLSRL